jgi:hypothetical protein
MHPNIDIKKSKQKNCKLVCNLACYCGISIQILSKDKQIYNNHIIEV